MSDAERLYKIERLIPSNGSIGFAALLAELEVSPATLKRDLEYLRSRLGAPIVYDRGSNGYRCVEAEMDAGYGIYAGGTRRTAVLHSDAQAAQWASKEEWHPEQQGR